ncbi:hypothetical protein PR202_ga23183 [Eleusine coracana subsp. coracana]|uniref:Dof zinc finger protein n=2 Tax=Eleusine coracana TaxID=4511 RepID=A0AAV5D511_ELECO|nr:DNA-binding with one finger protein [Eleusine coracana]GJN05546.1 hypothetical protein PR202_ga23183 [Eleusine coracana subsp. coracana]
MQVSRAAAAMEAAGQQQVGDGNALALVAVSAAGSGPGPKEPAGVACPRCESRDTKFCYYNNYNLGQPRHFCKGCRRYWTRGGALRNVPVGGGSRKPTSPAAAARRKQHRAASVSATASPTTTTTTSPAAALMTMMAASPAPLSVSAPPAYAAAAPRAYDHLPLPPFMLPSSSPPIGDHHHDRGSRMMLAHAHHDRRILFDADRRLLELGGSFTSLLAPPDAHFSAAGFLAASRLHPPPSPAPAPALLPPPPQQQQPPVMSHVSPTEAMIWGGMGMGMGWPDLSI